MKHTLRPIFALALIVVMLVGCFAGCAPADDNGDATGGGLNITGPVTINILTTRHPESVSEANDLWFFNYMEYWFAQQGYDVTINVSDTDETTTQIGLLLGSDTLPDLIWAIQLSASNTVRYGVDEGMLLDWTPYLEQGLMPNLQAQYEANPSMKAAHIAPDGKMYGIPNVTPNPYSTIPGLVNRVFVRQSWLDAVGKEVPTTQEEFLDVLRAFKNYKMPDGSEAIPLLSDNNFLEKYLWTCLGYYGTEAAKYGNSFMIKDEKVQLPCYTEDYREFIKIMNTLYTEGLIPQDYFSASSGSIGAQITSGNGGMHAWWTLQYVGDDYEDQALLGPIPMGDNDDVYVSRLSDYSPNRIWASSQTQYPELLAMMVDYMFSEEGAMLYNYGPKQGEDPLGQIDGWYYDEKGQITNDMVEDGTYTSFEIWSRDYIRSHDYAGLRISLVTNGTGETVEYKDAVTGGTYTCIHDRTMTRSDNDEWWRMETIETWSDYATVIRLPQAYLDSETNDRVTDLKTAINEYVTAESAKFISGKRPLSELDDYFAQLKVLGVEEYIKIYTDVYANFIAETYK